MKDQYIKTNLRSKNTKPLYYKTLYTESSIFYTAFLKNKKEMIWK